MIRCNETARTYKSTHAPRMKEWQNVFANSSTHAIMQIFYRCACKTCVPVRKYYPTLRNGANRTELRPLQKKKSTRYLLLPTSLRLCFYCFGFFLSILCLYSLFFAYLLCSFICTNYGHAEQSSMVYANIIYLYSLKLYSKTNKYVRRRLRSRKIQSILAYRLHRK